MIYHTKHSCYIVSQQPEIDEVSNIIFSKSSISELVILILSKNNSRFVTSQFFANLPFR